MTKKNFENCGQTEGRKDGRKDGQTTDATPWHKLIGSFGPDELIKLKSTKEIKREDEREKERKKESMKECKRNKEKDRKVAKKKEE